MVYNKSELARKTGLSRVAISRILNHKQKNPKLSTLQKLAKALDCTIDELVSEGEKQPI